MRVYIMLTLQGNTLKQEYTYASFLSLANTFFFFFFLKHRFQKHYFFLCLKLIF
jgi:hypothetical protein